MSDRNYYTKVSVNLLNTVLAKLELAASLGQQNKTDTINRAISLYYWILALENEGDLEFVVTYPHGVRRYFSRNQ